MIPGGSGRELRIWKRSENQVSPVNPLDLEQLMKAVMIGGVCMVLLVVFGAAYYATHRIPIVDRRPWVQAGHQESKGNFLQKGEVRSASPGVVQNKRMCQVQEN